MTTRSRKAIYVRCSLCDQLHHATYLRMVATAVGPVAMFTATCELMGMTSEYLEDEEVKVP